MLISVIIPIYNYKRYLARCVDSVLAQTHTDLELILVDDGSTDGSGAICDDYAARDPRVKVMHKANGGVSVARNHGLDVARGEFIAFCDNDDFYAPTMLERLLAMCLENDCGLAQCRSVKGAIESLPVPPPQPVKVIESRAMLEKFYTEGTVFMWDKLCRRRVWEGVRFPAGSYTGEDVFVVHRLLLAAGRVAMTGERLYCHYHNPESIMQRGFDVRWATGALTSRLEFAREHGLVRFAAETAARRVYEDVFLRHMNRRHNTDAASCRAFESEHAALTRYFHREARRMAGLSARDRVMMCASIYAPPLYHLYNWLKWRVVRGQKHVRFGEIR